MVGVSYRTHAYCANCCVYSPKENVKDRVDILGRGLCIDCGRRLRTHPKNTHRKFYLRLLEEIG